VCERERETAGREIWGDSKEERMRCCSVPAVLPLPTRKDRAGKGRTVLFGGVLPRLTTSDGCGKEKSSSSAAKLLVGLNICRGVLFRLGSLVIAIRFAVGIFVFIGRNGSSQKQSASTVAFRGRTVLHAANPVLLSRIESARPRRLRKPRDLPAVRRRGGSCCCCRRRRASGQDRSLLVAPIVLRSFQLVCSKAGNARAASVERLPSSSRVSPHVKPYPHLSLEPPTSFQRLQYKTSSCRQRRLGLVIKNCRDQQSQQQRTPRVSNCCKSSGVARLGAWPVSKQLQHAICGSTRSHLATNSTLAYSISLTRTTRG
jgi:hypothetical protein